MDIRIISVIVLFEVVSSCSLAKDGYTPFNKRLTCALESGVQWLLENRNSEWGWGERQEAEAIIALHLANDTWFNKDDPDSYISVKQMNIDLLVALSKDNALNDDLWSNGKLAHYICGLKATCQDPRDFYGHDLITKLEAHLDKNSAYFQGNHFAFSWAVLALCNSNEVVKRDYVSKLTANPGNYTFGMDEASMVLMALSCINISLVSVAKTAAEDYILQRQDVNGSFGNEYTTGLAIQALIASGRHGIKTVKDRALDALVSIKAPSNGTFLNVAAAAHVLPALAQKSYVDIGRLPCVEKENTEVTTLGPPIQLTISVEDRLFSHVNKTWTFIASSGITLYDALKVLQEQSTGFSFQSVLTSWGHSIRSIIGIASDASKRTYWGLYNATGFSSATGVSSTFPHDGDHFVFKMSTY